MVEAIRLRNLRSFPNEPDIDYIELKPITVLVGKNSSGKSSFIRTLPLLRQSVEAKTTGPILWYGSYVDFGAYSEVIKNDCNEDVIYFDFKMNINPMSIRRRNMGHIYSNYNVIVPSDLSIPVVLELGVSHLKNETIAKKVQIKIENHEFEIDFDGRDKCNLKIKNDSSLSFDKLNFSSNNNFIPRLGTVDKFERLVNGTNMKLMRFDESYTSKVVLEFYTTDLKKYFHKNTQLETILKGINRIGVCKRSEVERRLLFIFSDNKTFIDNLRKNTLKNVICDLFYKVAIYNSLNEIISSINLELDSAFRNVRYIAPLRATAERYYRHQDLQVDEIDHTGSNLAMLLKSFSDSEKRIFSSWTLEHFGFAVRAEELGLHYELMIRVEDDTKEYNINDMGFGFSQILPIVASIWVEVFRKKGAKDAATCMLFAIEQPELHLHPEYQSRLAILFAKVIQQANLNKLKVKIIFETHSKTMIDALGDCVEDNIISNEDINVVLFSKDKMNDSRTHFSYFDEEGFLTSWPVGFFTGRK